MLGRGSTLLGAVAAAFVLVGGIGAAVAMQDGAGPTVEVSPPVSAVPVADAAPVPASTTTTDTPTTTSMPVASTRPAGTGGGGTSVSFVVPPRTFVHLDARGRPIEAMTNTTRPPALSDQFLVEANGSVTPGNAGLAQTVVSEARAAGGDWSQPGVWHHLAG